MTTVPPSRELLVSWDDPAVSAAAARRLSGLDFLRAIQRGEYPPPPLARLLGFTLDSAEPGTAQFGLVVGEQHYNPIGTVHGGVVATLLDSALGCAVQTLLPPGTVFTTLELHTNFIKAVTASTGRIMARATTIHLGGRTATAEGRVIDEAGVLYAHATTTCLLFRPGKNT